MPGRSVIYEPLFDVQSEALRGHVDGVDRAIRRVEALLASEPGLLGGSVFWEMPNGELLRITFTVSPSGTHALMLNVTHEAAEISHVET